MRKISEPKIILFLNGERGQHVLIRLLKEKMNVILIVTGRKISDLPQVEVIARQNSINLEYCNDVNHVLNIKRFSRLNPDLFIIAGFSQLFSKNLLKLGTLGTLNLHAGKLPEYRGGSPLNWQIINGEKKIGISVIKVDEGIDTGNVIKSEEFNFDINNNIEQAHKIANALFPSLVLKAIKSLINGSQGTAQSNENARYWIQRSKSDSHISINQLTAIQVINNVRALSNKYGGAILTDRINNVCLEIYSASLADRSIYGTPGRMVSFGKGKIYVICKDMAVKLNDFKFIPEKRLKLSEMLFY